MKKLNILLTSVVLILSTLSSCSQQPTLARLSGNVDSYKGEGYLLCIFNTDNGQVFDTLTVDARGDFQLSKDLPQATKAALYLEYLGDNRCLIEVFMINGTESKVKITSSEKDGRLISTPEFYGDNKGESTFLKVFQATTMGEAFSLEKAVPLTFKDYQAEIKAEIDKLRTLLAQAKNTEFKTENFAQLDQMERTVPFRFTWAKRNAGIAMDADPDFVEYVQSFDLNNPDNITTTEQILRWYMGCKPDPAETNRTIREMKLMKKMISNQEIINELANTMMDMELAMGGSEHLKAIYDQYCQTSTDTETIRKLTPIYNQLVKLVKGVPASDFEMQDTQGKTLRFRQVIGQGKVTYIDFWATWCGPCCAEIPYVEKLVEKYKNNPDIEFISISLDKDVKKWHKKLNNDNPSWPQFIIPDNFNSTFAKEYNITAIPRFMVFDRKGNIITVNAQRPSGEDIDSQIESWLKQ